MKYCVFGAGAIGSLIGGKLAQSGMDVSLIGRGRHLEAMQQGGLTLASDLGEEVTVHPRAARHASELDKQDVIILSTKSHSIAASAEDIASLMHDKTVIVHALNGLPWWYFYKHGGKWDDNRLKTLDPHDSIRQTLGPDNMLGCAIYLAAHIAAPGRVEYVDNDYSSLYIGEPDNTLSERCVNICNDLQNAGIATHASEDIRTEIWHKLWGNIAMNPVTALTHATMDAVVENYDDTDLIEAIMNEARFVAEKTGILFREGPSGRIAKAAKMKGHKTSMLQDIEQGRPTEIDAIVGAVREIGAMVHVETPHLNGLYTLVRLKERFYKPA